MGNGIGGQSSRIEALQADNAELQNEIDRIKDEFQIKKVESDEKYRQSEASCKKYKFKVVEQEWKNARKVLTEQRKREKVEVSRRRIR